jgi:Protein of unknown function (DUF2408)
MGGAGFRKVIIHMIWELYRSAFLIFYRHGEFDDRFKPTYEKLCDIRNQLEKLTLTQAWSLRETDLFSFQRELDRIDEARVNGQFVDEQGNVANLFCQRVYASFYPNHVPWLTMVDFVIPSSTELCLYLQSYSVLGACFRSPSTGLQPAPNPKTMSNRGQKIRWG